MTDAEVEVGPPPRKAAVAVSWQQVTPTLYAELQPGVTVGQLGTRRDVGRWTPTLTEWGGKPVLQLLDTNRPLTAVGAVAGWFLGEAPGDDAQRHPEPFIAAADLPVRSVLLADFADAPEDPDPLQLLGDLGEPFAPPWDLCEPATDLTLRMATDAERGLKLGILLDSSKEPAVWRVSNIEYLPPGSNLEELWQYKGFGTCKPLGQLLPNGRWKPAKDAG